MLTHLTNAAFVLGYLLVVACYVPQWLRILRTRETAGISPGLLGMVTAGLVLIQVAALGGAWGALMAWGNGAALVNALITDAAYLWARRGRKDELPKRNQDGRETGIAGLPARKGSRRLLSSEQ